MIIKEVRIRNFRSIIKADLVLNELSIFVGLNDVGKSNVLKALNLFFNGETDYEKKLDFDEDYCKYSPKRIKKAPEITVEIIFKIPSSYNKAKDTKWTKTWRKIGVPTQTIKFNDGTNFPAKTKIYSWLQNVRFSYVPAIRGNSYFYLLLSNLHDSLAETIEAELRLAGDEFIGKIKTNTEPMIDQINKRLNINSQIKLPSNLQSLFRTLDFSTQEGGFQVSLSNRGDGIKTRHIPVILKFIADQLNKNKKNGAPSINMIWGYEEPENNLEMLAAFNLAKEFFDYSNSLQILITTHSPGFYTLKEEHPEKINLFKVSKSNSKEAEINEIQDYSDLDKDMGLMPLIAPYIKEKIQEVEKLQADIKTHLEELAALQKHSLFVEGNDEKRVFEDILIGLQADQNINVSAEGLGCSGVKNQIMAWSWISGVYQFKAFGVFDNDESGISEHKKLQLEQKYKDAEQKNKVKAVKYKVPPHLLNLKKKIPNYPIELEEMYPPPVWLIAEQNDWLEKRLVTELNTFVNLDSLEQSLIDKISSLNLNSEEVLYVYNKVPDRNKDKLSKYLVDDKIMTMEEKYGSLITMFKDLIIKFLQ